MTHHALCVLSCCRALVRPYQILNFPCSSGLIHATHPGRYQNLNELNSFFDRCPGLTHIHSMSSCGLVHPPNTASSPTPANARPIEQASQASPTVKKCFGACDLLVVYSPCLLHLACCPVPSRIVCCTPVAIIALLSTLHQSDKVLPCSSDAACSICPRQPVPEPPTLLQQPVVESDTPFPSCMRGQGRPRWRRRGR